MEIGLENSIPTYSGGLGVLAGDSLKSAADLGLPVAGVSLLYRNGYFTQTIENGKQVEVYNEWDPSTRMKLLPDHVHIKIDGEDIGLRVWQYEICGRKGVVPVYFLDTYGNGNGRNEDITSRLYQGHRIKQEAILGLGGLRLLQMLGYDIDTYHMNESHAAFLTFGLLKDLPLKGVRDRCMLTTHSLVAGHESFAYDDVKSVLGDLVPNELQNLADWDGRINMTRLAANTSRFVNGVSKKHAHASADMFRRMANVDVYAVTNGVHSFTWTSPAMQAVFDADIPGWRDDPSLLERASSIPAEKIEAAHRKAKTALIEYIGAETGRTYDVNLPIFTYARRIAEYKRPELLLSDPGLLGKIMAGRGQIIFAGKAHPDYRKAKECVERINRTLADLRRGGVNAVYLPDYGMKQAALLTAGSDVWVNNPKIPLEASGTSGMCAAHNGVPQISTMDGWWCESRPGTGWTIGGNESNDAVDARDLYRTAWNIVDEGVDPEIMKNVIARNASHFNTQRMTSEYARDAYKVL